MVFKKGASVVQENFLSKAAAQEPHSVPNFPNQKHAVAYKFFGGGKFNLCLTENGFRSRSGFLLKNVHF